MWEKLCKALERQNSKKKKKVLRIKIKIQAFKTYLYFFSLTFLCNLSRHMKNIDSKFGKIKYFLTKGDLNIFPHKYIKTSFPFIFAFLVNER